MAQNVNKGNLYQAAERAKLNPAQKNQINSFADMYSKHTSLTNLPDAIAAIEYDQLSADQQKSMAEFFGDDETKPGQGAVMKAASWLVKPIVEPVKEALKAALKKEALVVPKATPVDQIKKYQAQGVDVKLDIK